MKTFKLFLDETYHSKVTSVDTDFVDLHGEYLDKVNRGLTQVTSEKFATPSRALEVITKFMAGFSVIVPQVQHLPEPQGEEVFAVSQFGCHSGYKPNGTVVPYEPPFSEKPDMFLYFCYGMNETGTYDAFAVVANDSELSSIMSMDPLD